MVLGFLKKGKKDDEKEAFQASELTEKNKEAILTVRRGALGDQVKNWKEDDPYSPVFPDEFEEASRHVVCKDTKSEEPVGYARVTIAKKVRQSAEWAEELRLGAFSGEQLEHVVVFSKVIVREEHRKHLPAMLLAEKCYEVAVEHFQAWACIFLGELSEFNFNRFLGFRPLARIHHSKFGGYRIPLCLIVHDYERLKASESPFYNVIKKKGCPKVATGIEWMKQYQQKEGRIDTGFLTFDPRLTRNYEAAITKGMGEKGRGEFMAKSFYLKCQKDEVVLRQGEGGTQMGFVMKGALEVRSQDKVLAVLAEGDVFGEIAAVLGIPRTADVVAAVPQTEIIMLRMATADSLSDKQDESAFWKNLSEILIARLIATSRLIGGSGGGAVFGEIASELGISWPPDAGPQAILQKISGGKSFQDAEAESAFWKKLSETLANRLTATSRLVSN